VVPRPQSRFPFLAAGRIWLAAVLLWLCGVLPAGALHAPDGIPISPKTRVGGFGALPAGRLPLREQFGSINAPGKWGCGYEIVSGRREWKLYGPDANGKYGTQNGVGCLDGVSPYLSLFNPVISDFRGNILGEVTNGVVTWFASRPTGYGAVPGYRPVALGSGADIAHSSTWRGRWPDITGYYNLGLRLYDPVAGMWLSYDSVVDPHNPNGCSAFGGDPINGFDSDGRCSNPNQQNASYQDTYSFSAWANEWNLPDYVVRKEDPMLVDQVLTSGYPEPPGGSLVDTVLNGSHDAGYPASTTPGGAPNINGDPLWIDVNQVQDNGGTIVQNPEIVDAMRQAGVSESQIGIYQANQAAEGEVVIQGAIPSTAINTAPMMYITRAGQGLGIVGAAASGWNLGQSINRSVDQGTPAPFVAQTVREVGGWGGAWAGFQAGAGIGAAAGIETGPGALLTGLGGGVIGGIAGYTGANWIGNKIEGK